MLYPKRDELRIVTDDALRYIVWQENGQWLESPKILTMSDYEAIGKSNKLFCRKVEEQKSKELLNKLDNEFIYSHTDI